MKTLRRINTLLLGVLAMGIIANPLQADDSFLTIGDKAPNIDIEHWMSDGDGSFDHTTKLEDGKVYVIEFWATWCGPCIRSMPHLSETQEEYADKGVQIISVSDETLEEVETFLKGKVRGKKDKTYAELTKNYCLTVDPDQSVYNDYFSAAGQGGIPCAFIVGKTGLIEWIGHPMEMDEPLEDVVGDKWDRESFFEDYEEEQKPARERYKLQSAMAAIGELVQAGKIEEASKKIDDLIKGVDDEDLKSQLATARTQMLINYGDDDQGAKAIDDFVAKVDDDTQALNAVAWGIWEKHERDGKVGDKLLKSAIGAAEAAVKLTPDEGAILDTLAHLVYLDGDLDRAIEIQEKALENAGQFKSDIEPFLKKLKKEKEGDGDEKEDAEGKDEEEKEGDEKSENEK